jgi:hypothetical protein
METWEITTDGTVWVDKMDAREGRYVKQRVGGRQGGSRRLHITTDDRRFNQEQVVEEMKAYDPFTNGALVLVSAEKADDIDSTYHLTTEDLGRLLEIKDRDLFESEVSDIKSELILRRLKELGETQATVAQLEFITELIRARYKVGGTQRTVREMMQAGEMSGGEPLSGR